MTVGIVTVAVGDLYRGFLPDWAEAVAALQTRADYYCIVTDRIDENIESAAETLGPNGHIMTSDKRWEYHPQVLVNEAIAECDTDWIVKMDADDRIYGHALNDWPDADVVMFGITLDIGERPRNLIPGETTADAIMRIEHNLVFSGSPFRRSLWEKNHYRDMIYEDWAFWVGCARQGARFAPTGRADYRYTAHEDQMSRHADDTYWTKIVRGLK